MGRAWSEATAVPEALRDEALSPLGPALAEEATGHGLGWFVGEDPTHGAVAWHTGHYAGFTDVWLIAPDAGIEIVALSSGSTRGVADLAHQILAHPDL